MKVLDGVDGAAAESLEGVDSCWFLLLTAGDCDLDLAPPVAFCKWLFFGPLEGGAPLVVITG